MTEGQKIKVQSSTGWIDAEFVKHVSVNECYVRIGADVHRVHSLDVRAC
jgi:hypothetical protein